MAVGFILPGKVCGTGDDRVAVHLRGCPFAACGFFQYHGMNAEQLCLGVYQVLNFIPKRLLFKVRALYHACMEETLALGRESLKGMAQYMKKREQGKEETDETKRNGKGVVRLIKTLQQALKMDGEKFKVPGLSNRPSRSSGSGRIGVFQSGQNFLRPSGFPISTCDQQRG